MPALPTLSAHPALRARRAFGALAALAALAAPIALAALAALAAAAPPPPLPGMLVDATWLAARAGDPGVVVLHVAERRAEYEAGHVPGARFLPYHEIAGEVDGVPVELHPLPRLRETFERLGLGDGVVAVIVGHPMAAARAWMTLDVLGYGDRAALLDGGMAAWRAAGHPAAIDAPPAARRGRLTRAPRPDRVVDAGWVHARLGAPRVALVDARPRPEYTGADGGQGGRHLAGHVPGAGHLYWQDLVVPGERPAFRDAAELRRRFEQAGAAPGDTVVAYCLVGMRASVTYFAARLLGYEARLYDGSWVDWSRRGLPAESGEGARRGAPAGGGRRQAPVSSRAGAATS